MTVPLEEKIRIGIIGLGYVGLPLAVEFGKRFKTVGFDINPRRIEALRKGIDSTLEVDGAALKEAAASGAQVCNTQRATASAWASPKTT